MSNVKGHNGQGHPYHLVNPSPWPLLAALGAFGITFGAVHWWQGGGKEILYGGFAFVIVMAFMWWRDVVREAQVTKDHTTEVRHGLRVGMGLFISSEVMFFVAFFWAYFHNRFMISPVPTQWPPANIQPMDAWGIPFINTCILLTSGLTVTWAHHALKHGKRAQLVLGLLVTVLLGATFLGLQVHEYGEATFAFKDGIFPSVFYMATGFHGFHVFCGTIFLIVCMFRSMKGDFTPEQHVGFEAAAWYWHFVDVVWIFLFVCVYWLSGAAA
jgi:cytochrome c oxidase subunit 3